nr:hypothetical protein BaRGS_022829 [Batillaria attramentaria]
MKSVYMDLGTTEAPDSANSSEHADKDAPSGVLPAALRVSLAVVLIVTMVVGILGNGVVCMLVYRKATMRSAINHLVAQLALADILLALVVMPFVLTGMLTVMPWSPGPSICSLFAFLQEMLVAVDTLILLTISVDRYLIIVRHREKLNTRRARCLIFVSWIYSFLITIPPLLGPRTFSLAASTPRHLAGASKESARRYIV